MTENGYVKLQGHWVLPQEIEILEQKRKEKLAQLDWSPSLSAGTPGWIPTRPTGRGEHQSHRRSFAARRWPSNWTSEQHRDVA